MKRKVTKAPKVGPKAKRDCETGRFVPAVERVTGCAPEIAAKRAAAKDRADGKARELSADQYATSYGSKRELVAAMLDRNRSTVDAIQPDSSGATFDSLNERLELRGRRKVTTIEGAFAAAASAARPERKGGRWIARNADWQTLAEIVGAPAEGFEIPGGGGLEADELERQQREHYEGGESGDERGDERGELEHEPENDRTREHELEPGPFAFVDALLPF